ncbi:Mat sexual cell fertilization-promoting factor [Apodospora peruviana]|uniref:Mat sexual cell fertilization-promoting factor n=1 Tax=Apodospora peruviana TaxID=516989 RepID=A0AAE0IJ30_9PEZI|nr:Mat sexual cell fertilization-promoting factor [Apodospora peruviana]
MSSFTKSQNSDRKTDNRVSNTMSPNNGDQISAKKKVNGFMGFRAYYSSLFSQFPQRGRSPLLTKLWRQDPFHNEWDFMCAVYSTIRTSLNHENISFKDWINSASAHLGIVARDKYMAALGWQFVRSKDGTNTLFRIASPTIQNRLQPMNGLGLFKQCLSSGLPVVDPRPIVAKLSDPRFDVICMTTHPTVALGLVDRAMGVKSLVNGEPNVAMATALSVPQGLPSIGKTQVHGVNDIHELLYADLPKYAHNSNVVDTETFFALRSANIDTMLGAILVTESLEHSETCGADYTNDFVDMSLPVDGSVAGKMSQLREPTEYGNMLTPQ